MWVEYFIQFANFLPFISLIGNYDKKAGEIMAFSQGKSVEPKLHPGYSFIYTLQFLIKCFFQVVLHTFFVRVAY